jgi:hypothetical protein
MFCMAKPVLVLFHRTKQRRRLLFGKNIAEQFGQIKRQNQGGQKPASRRRACPARMTEGLGSGPAQHDLPQFASPATRSGASWKQTDQGRCQRNKITLILNMRGRGKRATPAGKRLFCEKCD